MPSKRRPRRTRASERGYRWSQETIDEQVAIAHQLGTPASAYYEAQTYDPDDRRTVPPSGAWVAITTRLPSIEGRIDRHVKPGRVLWAERNPSADDEGYGPDGTYKVLLRTPWGEVYCWPHEYLRLDVPWLLAAWQEGVVTFHPTHVEAAQFNTVAFYARSRGISLGTAAAMALGSVEANIGWFEGTRAFTTLVEMLGRVGGPLTDVNHKRRAAARRRRTGA